jgi:aryl-alcohol dehydrogenase-like predicted oxidoreductase
VRTRALGQTGISISELALGTWGLSGDGYGPVTEIERDRTVDRALELGVTIFETADAYGRGAMEKCLGLRLAGREDVSVVTKVGTYRPETGTPDGQASAFKRFDPAYLREAVQRSQERLRRQRLDVVLLHQPTASTMSRGEAAHALKELKQSGAIRAWGVSSGDNYVARAAIGHGAEVIEVAYNAFFSRELHELGEDIIRTKVGVLARSVLSYGLLAGLYGEERDFEPHDHRSARWTRPEFETRLRQLDAIRPLVTGTVLTMRGAALRFVLSNDMISAAVLGPKNVDQLDQLVRESGTEPPYLTSDQLALLASGLARMGVVT